MIPRLLTGLTGTSTLPRLALVTRARHSNTPMIQQAISKAAGLVEALPYIQRFCDKVVVVKIGGSIMDDEQALSAILTDVVFMNYVGMQPVVVHGGGKAINNAMERA